MSPGSTVETKQDASSGFFSEYHQRLDNAVKEELLLRLKEAASVSDDAVFRLVFAVKEAHEAPVQVVAKAGKDAKTAAQLKEAGNRAFQHGDYRAAAMLYSRSAICLPGEQSEDLAVIFANRSAAFYRLDKHQQALEDVELALSSGCAGTCAYPARLRYKVHDRRARCLLALHHYNAARDAFRTTLLSLDEATDLSVEKRQKWQMDVQIMLKMMEKTKPQDVKEKRKEESVTLFDGKSSSWPAASTGIRFADGGSRTGRYAVATRDIPTGSTVLTELPHAAVLLAEHKDTNCFQCFVRFKAPLPCPTCGVVAFCSVSCRNAAMASHHALECGLLDSTLWRSGASVTCLIALRILTLQPRGSPLSSAVSSLVSHRDRRQPRDFLHRAHMAVFLVRCLRAAGYFGEPSQTDGSPNSESAPEPSEPEVTAGGQILTLLQILQFNAHEVSELRVTDIRNLESGRSVFLGGAIYPTLALFNHSCDPGIVRYFHGNKVVARTVKPIRCGDEIAENYGPIYTTTPMEERRATLRNQYWFDCQCEPCSDYWPLFSDMDPGEMRFRCQQTDCKNVIAVPAASVTSFMAECLLCHRFSNVLKGLKALQDTDAMLQLAQASLVEGKAAEALERFLAVLNLLAANLVPPFRDWSLCQQQIRTCMVALGNLALIKSF